MNIDTGRLSELKYKLICCFKLVADMVQGGIWEFVNDTDGSEFLERELMGLGVDGTIRSELRTVQVDWCPFTRFESS